MPKFIYYADLLILASVAMCGPPGLSLIPLLGRLIDYSIGRLTPEARP